MLGIKTQKLKQPNTDLLDLNADCVIEDLRSRDPQPPLPPPHLASTRSRRLFSFPRAMDEGSDRRRRSTLASVSSTVKKMFARNDSGQTSQTAPMEDNQDSHPYPSKEANNYPTLQLTRSNEKHANEGQLRFKNGLANLEVQYDGPSTHWKNEPFWNSSCQLSSNHSLGLDGKTRSRAQERDGDKKQNEHLAVQSPLSLSTSIETGPDLALCRMGSTSLDLVL